MNNDVMQIRNNDLQTTAENIERLINEVERVLQTFLNEARVPHIQRKRTINNEPYTLIQLEYFPNRDIESQRTYLHKIIDVNIKLEETRSKLEKYEQYLAETKRN
jgi:hypothetical protein